LSAKLGLFGALAAAVAVIASCGEAGQGPTSATAPPATSTGGAGTPSTSPSMPGNASEPYHFGDIQAKAPPTVDGMAPVVRKIHTDKRYVFITIDDGDIKDPNALGLIKKSGARPTLFLAWKYVAGQEGYFRKLRDEDGAEIQDHTINHPNLRGKPYELQRKEICDNADAETKAYGRRPWLFRPPYGNFDANTQKAAATCGMRVLVLWTAAVNDGVVQFQQGDRLNPGDIVLMHFRKTFVEDYTAFVERVKHDGLTAVPLSDFLG
jgi:peptidoglycan/xylan/chitin deacetylase (PgdA/CDA1 family)